MSTYAAALVRRHVLREARRGKAPRLAAVPDYERELLVAVIDSAFRSGFVRMAPPKQPPPIGYRGRCRTCGCTDDECSGCVAVIGEPCYWLAPGLCSACGPMELTKAGVAELARLERDLRRG